MSNEDNKIEAPIGQSRLTDGLGELVIAGMWLPDKNGKLVPMTMYSETGEAKPFSKSRAVQLRSSILHRLKSKLLALLGRTE